MKKTLTILIVLLMAVSLFACSLGADDDGSSSGGSDSNGDSGEKVNLVIGLPGGYDVTSEDTIDGFIEAHPEINVEVDEGPWGEYVEKIATRIAGNEAPTVWFQENAVILGYGERGVAEDLSAYIEQDLNVDDYIDPLFAAESPDGEVYGVPHGINPVALAYNKDIFDEADMDYPTDDWTYDDMIEAAKALTDEDKDQFGFGLGGNITTGWFPWIRANGGEVLDIETLSEARFTDPKSVEAIKIWASMIPDLKVSPSPDYSEAAGGDLFQKGKVAMYFMQYSNAVRNNREFPDLNYDTVMIPKGFDGNERVVPMVTNSWLIYSKASQEEKDAAWEFLKYYLGDEGQMNLTESLASLPVQKRALEALEEMTDTRPSNKKAFTQGIAESGETMAENATWQEWRKKAQAIFDDIKDGKMPVEEGMQKINEQVQTVLDDK